MQDISSQGVLILFWRDSPFTYSCVPQRHSGLQSIWFQAEHCAESARLELAVVYPSDIPETLLAHWWNGPRYVGKQLQVLVNCERPQVSRKLVGVLHDLTGSAHAAYCVKTCSEQLALSDCIMFRMLSFDRVTHDIVH